MKTWSEGSLALYSSFDVSCDYARLFKAQRETR